MMRRVVMMWALILVTVTTTANAQKKHANYPGLRDPYTNNLAHDFGHSLTSVAVSELARLLPNQNEWTRYMIGTVWFPIAHEIVDQFRYKSHKWQASWKDIVTYQAAWAVPLIQNGYIVEGIMVVAVVVAFIHSRYRAITGGRFRIRLQVKI